MKAVKHIGKEKTEVVHPDYNQWTSPCAEVVCDKTVQRALCRGAKNPLVEQTRI
jgi:hypothetical protein